MCGARGSLPDQPRVADGGIDELFGHDGQRPDCSGPVGHGDLDSSALRARHQLPELAGGELLQGAPGDRDDALAGLDAGPGCRRALLGEQDLPRGGNRREYDSNPPIDPRCLPVEPRDLLRVVVARVSVQALDHAVKGPIQDLLVA